MSFHHSSWYPLALVSYPKDIHYFFNLIIFRALEDEDGCSLRNFPCLIESHRIFFCKVLDPREDFQNRHKEKISRKLKGCCFLKWRWVLSKVKQSKQVYYSFLRHETWIDSNHSEVEVEIRLMDQDFLRCQMHCSNNYNDLEFGDEWDDVDCYFVCDANTGDW